MSVAALCLVLCAPLATAHEEALARIDEEQQAIERVLRHPELWRVAHRRKQELNERYWTLVPPARGEVVPNQETALTLPGVTVAQAGALLALFAEEEELRDLDRAQRRVFIAQINGGQLDRAEDGRARTLLRAIDDDTQAREGSFRTRLREMLTLPQRRALARVPPRMSPRGREVAYERLLKLKPLLAGRWKQRRSMRGRAPKSPFPLADQIARHRTMGVKLQELHALAQQIVQTSKPAAIAAWLQEPAPRRTKREGIEIWVVSPYGVRDVRVSLHGRTQASSPSPSPDSGSGSGSGSDPARAPAQDLSSSVAWRTTVHHLGHAQLAKGTHRLEIQMEQRTFSGPATVGRATKAIYVLAKPTAIEIVTVEAR